MAIDASKWQIRTELTPELNKINNNLTAEQLTMLTEIYRLLGLDPTIPLLVEINARSVGDIYQTIETDPNTEATTVTRI